jgi:hypothetical protein
MKTEVQLNQEILETTTMIRNEYPELIKYLDEIPVTIAVDNSQEMNIKALTDYAQSLKNIIIKYGVRHD